MTTQYKNPMVNRALDSLRALSADEKTRELAERREKALKDEAMFLNEARRKGLEEGRKEGLEEGRKEGLEEGRKEGLEKGERLGMQKAAIKLIQRNLLSVDQIAEATGLEIAEIENLKRSLS